MLLLFVLVIEIAMVAAIQPNFKYISKPGYFPVLIC